MNIQYVNELSDYNGKIVLEVALVNTSTQLDIINAEVFHNSWGSVALSLGYIMKSPVVNSSSCLCGYEDAGDIINLMQEAYTIFDLKETTEGELNYLGYKKVRR